MAKLVKKLRKAGPIAWIAVLVIRLLGRTVRFDIEDRCGITRGEVTEPVVWLFWHNRVLLMPYIQRRFASERHGAVLTSPSNDGEIIAQIMRRFGADAIRGSSNKRPAAAMREMIRCIRQGNDLAITPDGPRGPVYQLQAGATRLAQQTGTPLLCVHIRYQRQWCLKTWDRFIIPKPFTKAKVIFDELMRFEDEASNSERERFHQEVESRLRSGADTKQ